MKTIKVLPNPWSAIDSDGVPCGVCPRDPDSDGGAPGQYVGAKVCKENTKVLQRLRQGDDLRSARQKTIFSYLGKPAVSPDLGSHLLAAEPIEIPLTSYYRERLMERSIVCVDAESAGLARVPFFDPREMFPVLSVPEVSGSPVPEVAVPEAEQEQPALDADADNSLANKRATTRRN